MKDIVKCIETPVQSFLQSLSRNREGLKEAHPNQQSKKYFHKYGDLKQSEDYERADYNHKKKEEDKEN